MKLEKRIVCLVLVIINALFGKKVYGSEKAEKGSSVLSHTENYWKEDLQPITVPRYEFRVDTHWKNNNSLSSRGCLGILLNDRYVLLHSHCLFYERYRMQEMSVLSLRYGSVMSSPQQPVFESDYNPKFWSYGSITLYSRTNKPFKYSQQLRCINLPDAQELLSWKESYNIPNNVEIVSSRWCKAPTNWFGHLYLNGTRNCSNSIRYKTPRWLIPSCLLHKNPYNNCNFPEGNSLVYNNTLLGIKDYSGETPPPPYDKIKYDLFLNLIPFVNIIQAHMKDYTPCPY